MFRAINSLPCAVIGRIHGAALGGGAGLAAVCDIAISTDAAVFGFTETKLGILPAMISPFVLPKIGVSAARELFLTGMRFDARRAMEIGLVHAVVPVAELDETVRRYVGEILTAAPTAVAAAKRLIPEVWGRHPEAVADLTADAIAAQRTSPEGQDGLRAFLEKRKPTWAVE
jgi:methylglutaconyl-CoA hydratase